MPRLRNLPPAISRLPDRFTVQREQYQVHRLAKRETEVEWRSWYKTARWQALRQQVLVRDLFTCKKTGVMLIGKHPAPNSPVVDHIKRHDGDPALFWDEGNLQSVSKAWHDSIKQAIEHADQVAAIHPKWLKPSLIPLTIVCGPPASGKSSYVREHAQQSDLIIDLDVIASDISGEPAHQWDRSRWLNAALYRRNDLLGSLSRPSDHAAAWFIVSEPKAQHRDWWQRTLRPKTMAMMLTSEAECVARARADAGRNFKATCDAIVRWWFDYSPRRGEIIITPGGGQKSTGPGERTPASPAFGDFF